MTTRREVLTKCGAGLAAIIAAGKAPAAVVRSMLGARGAMTIGSTGWKNPYVTNGLIAMWDGEWNAGPGIHDPNAKVWKDLTNGGRDWTLNTNKCYFGDNFIYINGKCGSGEWVIPRNEKTTEAVFAFKKSMSTSILCECNSYNLRPRMQISVENRSNNIRVGFNGYYHSGASWDNVTSNHSYSVNASLAFQDGISKERTNWKYFGTGNASTSTLGGEYDNNVYEFVGTVYCIRYYNRYLTEEEIQHNYLVDKERFNLP